MNKLYKSIDDIKLTDDDKKRMYNNIMEQSISKKSSFDFRIFLRYAAIVMLVGIFSVGSVYAMAKIFNWDDKFLGFFEISQEETEKYDLEISEINKSIKIGDMNIVIKQATMFDKKVYFLLDITFDNPKETLAIGDRHFSFDAPICSIEITRGADADFGSLRYVYVNDEKTNAVAVAYIYVEDTVKKGDNIKIGFLTNYIEEKYEDGSSMGYCQDKQSVDWVVDIDGNNGKVVYEFEKKYYLKNNDVIKIYPMKITITPIDINLDLILNTDLEFTSDILDENLKFDEDIKIVFNDGTCFILNSIDENGKYAQGTELISYDIKEEKHMSLVWDNMYSFYDFSNIGFSIIDVDNIKNIQIGNNIFELNK